MKRYKNNCFDYVPQFKTAPKGGQGWDILCEISLLPCAFADQIADQITVCSSGDFCVVCNIRQGFQVACTADTL